MELKRSYSVPKLLDAMRSSSGETSRAATLALGRVDENSAVTDLANLLSSKRVSRTMKLNAIEALGLMRQPDAGKVLAQNLPMDSDPMLQTAILSALGQFGEIKHLDSILSVLRNESDPAIVRAALAAAAKIVFQSPKMRIPLPNDIAVRLFALLKEPNPDNALLAATILQGLPGSALSQKEELILDVIQKSRSLWLQQKLYQILAKTVSEKGLNFFLQQSENEKRLSLRLTAISQLPAHVRKIPSQNEKIQEILRLQMRHTESLVRLVSLKALRELERVDGKAEIVATELFQKDPSPSVRAEALHVLLKIHPAQTTEYLRNNALNSELPIRRKLAELILKDPSDANWAVFLENEKNWENLRTPLVEECFWTYPGTLPEAARKKLVEQFPNLDRSTQTMLLHLGQRFSWELPPLKALPPSKVPDWKEIQKWNKSRVALLSPRGKFQFEFYSDSPLNRYLLNQYLGTAKQALRVHEILPPDSVTLISGQELSWLAPQEVHTNAWVERGEIILTEDPFNPMKIMVSIRSAPQLLIDRHSTVIGRVVQGMDSVEHLEVGDEIRLSP